MYFVGRVYAFTFLTVFILIAYNYIAISTFHTLSNTPLHPYSGVLLFPGYSGNENSINRLIVYIHDPLPCHPEKKEFIVTSHL